MWQESRIFLPDDEKRETKPMKNTRAKFIAAVIGLSLCMTSAVSVNVKGCGPDDLQITENPDDISYIIDFLDYDGNFLDSKICTYGQKLEDIRIPQREEDEEYTYRFTGWEPELNEVVTEGAAYIAVYEKIPKDGSNPEMPEVSSNSQEKPIPENSNPAPKSPDQIYSISYEVVPIQVETPIPTPVPVLAPAVTPGGLELHVGKIHNMTVPVIHTSKAVKENMGEAVNGPSADASLEEAGEKDSDAVLAGTVKDKNTSPARKKGKPGAGQKAENKGVPGDSTKTEGGTTGAGEKTKRGGMEENAETEPGNTENKDNAETGKEEGAVEDIRPETSQAFFGKQVSAVENQVPVSLILSGSLGWGLCIWHRERKNKK